MSYLARYDTKKPNVGDRFDGCVEEKYKRKIDKACAWERVKDLGNAALKQGDNKKAITYYRDACMMTRDDDYLFYIIRQGFRSAGNASAIGRKLFECDDMVNEIGRYMRRLPRVERYEEDNAVEIVVNGSVFKFKPPNQPAAICLGNLSVAYMNIGEVTQALQAAKVATKLCPGYLKGHGRVQVCLHHLATAKTPAPLDTDVVSKQLFKKREDLKKQYALEAKKKAEQMGMYEQMNPTPSYCSKFIMLRWMGFDEWDIYQTYRRQCIFDWIKYSTRDKTEPVNIGTNASLVEFLGGQFLLFNLTVFHPKWFREVTIDAVHLQCLDKANDADLNLPPHGRPSARAAEYSPRTLRKFVEECQDNKLRVTSLMLGQGLVEMVAAVTAEVQEVCDCLVSPVMKTRHGFVF
jgi:hypothetical protein